MVYILAMSFFCLNGLKPFIKRTILQISLLLVLTAICLAVFLIAGHILKLPFRSVNDVLHQENASFTLDFLIAKGTYINEKMTIGEVIGIRTRKETSLYENIIRSVANLIPVRYRYGADIILFLFWTFLFMIFFRLFTFTGYGRALRASLFIGGLVYFFLPDFSPGEIDDAIFVTFPLLIIFLRIYLSRRRKKAAQKSV
ncbi:MAG: hypothetical protein MUO88_22640 [Desulfobacterales bacterium]|nr:hypothetical protein [Desulfobacterales bacterium]